MKLNRDQIKKIIINVLHEQLGVELKEIRENSRLKEDLGADSLDAVEIIMAVEEALDIQTNDDILLKIKTVKQMIDYVVSLQPEHTDYMKFSVQLRIQKKKNKNSLLNKFKTLHKRVFSKMKIKR